MHDIQQIVTRQANKWNIERTKYEEDQKNKTAADYPAKARPVVTLSRQHGCRGRELAKLLAHALDYGLFDRNIIDYIADHLGVLCEVVETLDESARSELELWVQTILTGRVFDRDNYFKTLGELLKAISLQGGVVVVGRGANFMLESSSSFHIRTVASVETRIRNLIDLEGMNEKNAKEDIQRIDKERAQFVKRYFNRDINDPTAYDLVINMGNATLDEGVKIVVAALRARGWPLETTGGDKRTKNRPA